VPKNIALKLPYPKIKKTVPQFLIIDEYNRLIRNFSQKAQNISAELQYNKAGYQIFLSQSDYINRQIDR